jgi:hypothetical protein
MNKQDITMHNDEELSNLFDNDEELYLMARGAARFSHLKEVADELFIYNQDQLDNLEMDFDAGRWD